MSERTDNRILVEEQRKNEIVVTIPIEGINKIIRLPVSHTIKYEIGKNETGFYIEPKHYAFIDDKRTDWITKGPLQFRRAEDDRNISNILRSEKSQAERSLIDLEADALRSESERQKRDKRARQRVQARESKKRHTQGEKEKKNLLQLALEDIPEVSEQTLHDSFPIVFPEPTPPSEYLQGSPTLTDLQIQNLLVDLGITPSPPTFSSPGSSIDRVTPSQADIERLNASGFTRTGHRYNPYERRDPRQGSSRDHV